MSIGELVPKLVFKHFEAICGIPHPSGHEKSLGDHIVAFAESKGFKTKRDAAGNVVILVPAKPGREKAPIVVLQGHIDMVPEKNADVAHDFLKDPIRPRADGDYVVAEGTTLGADNGVGVAAAMAISEDEDAVHGPLEILCTVDEEVGLTGAMKLGGDMLKGRIMLNLDGEERYAAYIGCAGGGDTVLKLKADKVPAPKGGKALRVRVAGLKGGHSGCDIHLQRGNALRVLTRCLWEACRAAPVQIAYIKGGNKRNAIPREAEALIIVPAGDKDKVTAAINAEAEVVHREFVKAEPDLKVPVEDAEAPEEVLSEGSCDGILNLLQALPHGVERMSLDIPGLVETSTNLASCTFEDDTFRIELSTRSSIAEALQALRNRIMGVGRLAGAEVVEGDPYPGWKPDLDSKLAVLFKEVHKEVLGKEVSLEAIHAGLETGVIGEKFPGMDMISFGPLIENPHSPDERVHIESVREFYELLKAMLKKLAE